MTVSVTVTVTVTVTLAVTVMVTGYFKNSTQNHNNMIRTAFPRPCHSHGVTVTVFIRNLHLLVRNFLTHELWIHKCHTPVFICLHCGCTASK